MPKLTKHFGKYRGTVLNNIDPMQLGRIQVMIPDVLGTTPSNWAMPCVPLAGNQMGVYLVPQVGSSVWMEFEQGNADDPIWTGSFWSNAAQVPALGLSGIPTDPSIVVQSALQNCFAISDAPGPAGGIMLRSAEGASIIVNDTGIYIQNGKGASLVLLGPTVSINDGAFVVPEQDHTGDSRVIDRVSFEPVFVLCLVYFVDGGVSQRRRQGARFPGEAGNKSQDTAYHAENECVGRTGTPRQQDGRHDAQAGSREPQPDGLFGRIRNQGGGLLRVEVFMTIADARDSGVDQLTAIGEGVGIAHRYLRVSPWPPDAWTVRNKLQTNSSAFRVCRLDNRAGSDGAHCPT